MSILHKHNSNNFITEFKNRQYSGPANTKYFNTNYPSKSDFLSSRGQFWWWMVALQRPLRNFDFAALHTISCGSYIAKKRQYSSHWIQPLNNVNASDLDVIIKFQLVMSASSMDDMVSMCRNCVHPYGRETRPDTRLP